MFSSLPHRDAVASQQKPGRLGRVVSLLARLGLTLVLIVLIAYFVDWRQFLQIIKSVHSPTLFLAGLLCCADRVVMSYKWGLLLKVQGIAIPLWLNLRMYSASALAGLALPATVGGDALRAVWMTRRGAQATAVTSSIVLERLVGTAAGCLFGIAGITYLFVLGDRTGPLKTILGLVIVVSSVFLLGLVLSFSGVITKRFGYVLKTYVSERIFDIVQPFHQAYTSYRSAWGCVGSVFALSILRQFIMLAADYTIVRALGIDVELLTLWAALAVTFIFSRIPIAITDIGVHEGVLILLLLPVGLQPTDIVAMSAVGRILGVLTLAPGTLAAFLTGLIDSDTFRRRGGCRADVKAATSAARSSEV